MNMISRTWLRFVIMIELVRARYLFAVQSVDQIMDYLSETSEDRSDTADRSVFLEELNNSLPALSRRLPFRSDCIIQCLAAKRILDAKKIPTTFQLAATRPGDNAFAAHAWLTCQNVKIPFPAPGHMATIIGPGSEA